MSETERPKVKETKLSCTHKQVAYFVRFSISEITKKVNPLGLVLPEFWFFFKLQIVEDSIF